MGSKFDDIDMESPINPNKNDAAYEESDRVLKKMAIKYAWHIIGDLAITFPGMPSELTEVNGLAQKLFHLLDNTFGAE